MDAMFEKIGSKSTLSQEIEVKIEQAILQRKLISGERMPSEKELCEAFGVSRTAMREALRMLSAKGLITIRKGDGIYVNEFSTLHANRPMSLYLELKFDKSYVMHLIHVRQMIEPSVAALAALNRTKDDIEDLSENLRRFNNPDASAAELARLDLEFHLKLAHASANPLIPLIMEPLYKLLPKIKTLILKKLKKTKSVNAINYHQRIFEYIEQGDDVNARESMIQHLQIAEKDAIMLISSMSDDENLF